MKKVLFAIATAAILMGAVSCQQDEFKGENNSVVKNPLNTIVVTIGNDATRLGLVSGEDVAAPVFELDDEVFGWDANGKYTYKCTAVNGTEATFTKTSTYAPSADAGTKVNLVFAKGYGANDVVDGKLNIDISEQKALTFSELPIVMTASGTVDANGQCKMVFKSETSVISAENCTSTATVEIQNVYADNLYPTMSFAINAEGEFVRTPGKAGKICNAVTLNPTAEDKSLNFCIATFPTPENAEPAQIMISFTSTTDFTYFFTSQRTIPENMILTLEVKFALAQHLLVETGTYYSTFREAIDAVNAYEGPCTLKVISDCQSSSGAPYDITNVDGVTYDLNGKSTALTKDGRLRPVGEGMLTIIDSNPDGTGRIWDNWIGYSPFNLNAGGYLYLESGIIGQKVGGNVAVIELSADSYFEMNGGQILAEGRFFMFSGGSPMVTITDGELVGISETYDCVQSTADGALMTISGGYFYSPQNDECNTFSLNPDKLTGIDIFVSGGHFNQDISQLPVVTINGKWETCEEDYNGLTYTYRAVK